MHKSLRVVCFVMAAALAVSACGGDDDDGNGAANSSSDSVTETTEDAVASDTSTGDASPVEDDTTEPTIDDTAGAAGGGVILADLCAEGEVLNGAVSVDDLVSIGLFTSDDVTFDSNAAYEATDYETFGFICNISEAVSDGENFLTIGVSSGSETWDLAVEQGDAPAETMGDWDVIVGSNWLSPLTMRTTDEAGNQDSLFVTWTPSDGSIPDAATLEQLMRPLAQAIASGGTVDIPRS